MRIIDADKLCEMMYHEAFEKDSDMQKWDSGCWIRYKLFENVMEKLTESVSIEQIKWERDTAIAQLKELGYSLGEKTHMITPCYLDGPCEYQNKDIKICNGGVANGKRSDL